MGPKILPKGARFWTGEVPIIDDIAKLYEAGYAGAYGEPEEKAALIAENKALHGFGSLDEAATANNWADSGAGKLVLPYVHVVERYPKAWPGPAQPVGDCVGRSSSNSALLTTVCEVVGERPDEETGRLEDFPEVSETAERNSVIASEGIYWYRGHGGHGWSCGAACRVMQRQSGLWVRRNYPELNIDLTVYTKRNIELYGRTAPTGKVAEQGRQNLVRAFAEVKSREARRDALANGYGLNTCGMESFANTRDANGQSRRTNAGWAHAMAVLAFDDRKSTIDIYGDTLELYLNSWAVWNSGPRDIRDSAQFVPPLKKQLWISLGLVNPETGNLLIPHGAFWVRSRDVASRDVYALSSVNGFPRRKLPDYGFSLGG